MAVHKAPFAPDKLSLTLRLQATPLLRRSTHNPPGVRFSAHSDVLLHRVAIYQVRGSHARSHSDFCGPEPRHPSTPCAD